MTTPHSPAGEPIPAPGAVQQVDTGGMLQLVTELKSTEQQIGEHTMRALSQEGTVAVLTAVVVGADGRQRIVSIALDEPMTSQVQTLMQGGATGRTEDVPCVGFHCYLRPKEPSEGPAAGEAMAEDENDAKT